MKLFIVFITLLFTSQTENGNTDIYGRWKLIKIETSNEVLIPKLGDYTVFITNEKLSYNLEFNKCESMELSINANRINMEGIMCTEICCDGRSDSISNFINYNGTYEIVQNQLIITTTDSKLFLVRLID